MFINITIRSKNKNSLKKFLNVFKNLSKNKRLQLNKTLKFFQKKRYNKVFTILKSPHVNKTAQEQFEFNLFAKSIKIKSFQVLKTLIVLKKIQSTFFSDIQIKIKFIINSKSKKKILINNFKPTNIKVTSKYRFNFKQIELYLLLFNFYGRYSFTNRLNSSVGRAKD